MKGTRIIDESVNNTVFLPMSLQMAVQVITGIGAHISCKSAASPARPFSSAALTYFLGAPFSTALHSCKSAYRLSSL